MPSHSSESQSIKTHLYSNWDKVTTLKYPATKKNMDKMQILGCGFECIPVVTPLKSSRISWTYDDGHGTMHPLKRIKHTQIMSLLMLCR